MTLDPTRFKEMMDIFGEIADIRSDKKDALSTFSEKLKEANGTLKSWCENNQIEVNTVKFVLGGFLANREGKVTWKDGEDENVMTLLNSVMDAESK